MDGAAGDLLIRFVAAASAQPEGAAVFATGSTFNFELAASGTSDRIDFTGLTTAGAGSGGGGGVAFNNNVVNFTGLAGVAAGEYTLFTFNAASQYTGTLAMGTLPAGITGATFDYSDPLAIKVNLAGGTPYSLWAATYLPGNDVSNPAGDNDNDGLVNQQEFAFGLSTISGSSTPSSRSSTRPPANSATPASLPAAWVTRFSNPSTSPAGPKMREQPRPSSAPPAEWKLSKSPSAAPSRWQTPSSSSASPPNKPKIKRQET